MNLPPHCESCATYPQAYRLGYAEALEGPVGEIGQTPDVPTDVEDESNWWLAYSHGKAVGRDSQA